MRVLIADDESIIRMDLRETLARLGYEVEAEARDGAEALALARALRPDVAILDVKMPKMDGIQAAGTMIAEGICPVLILTAYGEVELVRRARDAGVMGYLVKPFREEELVPSIEIARARFEQMVALEKEAQEAAQALASRKLVDRAKAVLMESQGLTEPEAFRRIQKAAMDTRKPMREVAEAIILSAETSAPSGR